MATVTIIKKDIHYYDKNNNRIHSIKEFRNNKLRPVYKSKNNVVQYDLINYSNRMFNFNTKQVLNEKMIENNIQDVFNKFFKKRKKLVNKIAVLFTVVLIIVCKQKMCFAFSANAEDTKYLINFTGNSVACAADNSKAVAACGFNESIRFVHYIINIMRGLIASLCGLNVASSALNIALEERCNVQLESKKVFQKIMWALFLAFAGTGIAELIAKKILLGEI